MRLYLPVLSDRFLLLVNGMKTGSVMKQLLYYCLAISGLSPAIYVLAYILPITILLSIGPERNTSTQSIPVDTFVAIVVLPLVLYPIGLVCFLVLAHNYRERAAFILWCFTVGSICMIIQIWPGVLITATALILLAVWKRKFAHLLNAKQ